MGFSYLQGKDKKALNWRDITRDERTYCAELFFEAREPKKLKAFLTWLNKQKVIKVSKKELEAEWELGYEVCFYRDVRKMQGKAIKKSNYSQKRTFDLCLFSENRIIIIEAKAQKGFEKDQNKEFEKDKKSVRKVLGKSQDELTVEVIALASSKYYINKEKRGGLDKVFTGHFSWKELYDGYAKNPVFMQADESYKK
jgi:hypothetical protein